MAEYKGAEQRGKPRLYEAFPAKVRGSDKTGQIFEVDVLLHNLSASGLYLVLPRQVELGAVLSVTIRLAGAESLVSAARVRTRGVVVRVEPGGDACGLAVAFNRQRSL